MISAEKIPNNVNLSGNKLPHSPEFKVKVGAEYTTGLFGTGWTTTARLDYVWQDSYFAREFNTTNDRIKAWSVANASLRVDNGLGTISVEAFIKNISNKDNITNSIIESDLVGSYRNARILEPRTYGVQTTFKF